MARGNGHRETEEGRCGRIMVAALHEALAFMGDIRFAFSTASPLESSTSRKSGITIEGDNMGVG